MTATITACDTALQLARDGYHVHPLKRREKAPRTEHGHLDATRDRATIQQWWAPHPDDNCGIALEASGVLITGPDCDERLHDFERRGLPETMVVQSGSGPGHRHYYYRRPAGCPILRLCKSGDYDLLTDGYIVAPGSVTHGPYELLTPARSIDELPEAPDWAVAMLRHEAARRAAVAVPVTPNTDEPPVRLGTAALAWWTGERQAKGGDRSGTLYAIAIELYRAGATVATIAACLAERDRALFTEPKYAGRPDAAQRYRETAGRAAAAVEGEGALIVRDEPPIRDTSNIAALRTRVRELEAENQRLRNHQIQAVQVRHNAALKTERETAVVLAYEIANVRAEARARGDKPEGATKLPTLHTLGERIAVSESKISRDLKKLESWGVLDKQTTATWKPERVTSDGEILKAGWVSETFVTLPDEPEGWLAMLATFEPPRTATHGGARTRRCPDHPDADIRIVESCAACDRLLRETFRRAESSENRDGVGNCKMQAGDDARDSSTTVDVPISRHPANTYPDAIDRYMGARERHYSAHDNAAGWGET